MRTRESGKRAFSLWLPLRALALASAVALVSCGGGGGDSDGTLCQQCGDDPDGPCLPEQFLEGGPPAAALCVDGPSCTVPLFCLRKLGSSQRRCFPGRQGSGSAEPSFECDGSRPNTEIRICGNGTVESDEDCDGDDDANCPGDCQEDCTCPVATPTASATPSPTPTRTPNGNANGSCNNGVVEDDEECDLNEFDGEDCDSLCVAIDDDLPVSGALICTVNSTIRFEGCLNATDCEP